MNCLVCCKSCWSSTLRSKPAKDSRSPCSLCSSLDSLKWTYAYRTGFFFIYLQFWSFSHHTHTYTHNRLHTLTYTSPIEQFINICYSFYWNKIIILDVKETVFRLNISHGGGCWLTYCVDCFKWQFREKTLQEVTNFQGELFQWYVYRY